MTGRLLEMGRKPVRSKIEGRGLGSCKGIERGRHRVKSKGPEIDMTKQRHPNTVSDLKILLDTGIGRTMVEQGGGRERTLHSA